MKRIGLTGGIASGKSTVARVWAELGIPLVDADAVSKRLTGTHGAAMPAIAQQFGAAFVNTDGSLNRAHMRQWVFNKPSEKNKLQALLHPLIHAAMAQDFLNYVNTAPAQGAATAWNFCVFDIPLLVESKHWRAQLDAVVVIDCLPQTQLQRVMQRDNITTALAQRIISQQCARETRLQAADLVLSNEGISLASLCNKARGMLSNLT